MESTYLTIYLWGILANICLVFILIILRSEYKSRIYNKNLDLLKNLNIVKKDSMLVRTKRAIFFFSVLLSWIYTSFLCLLIFVRIFRKQLSDFDDIYLNCITIFSKEELCFHKAFVIYLLILNQEVLYSSVKAEEYILELSQRYNFEISKEQIQEVFETLGF